MEDDLIEIDLTRPFRITSNPLLARRAENPGAGAPLVEKPSSLPAPEVKPEPPKEWVLPGPDTQVLEKPAVEEPPAPTPPEPVIAFTPEFAPAGAPALATKDAPLPTAPAPPKSLSFTDARTCRRSPMTAAWMFSADGGS